MKSSRVFSVLRTCVLLAILCFGVFAASAEASDRYAAIAYSQSTGRWGTASNYKSKDAAIEAAVENCGARNPVVMWSKNAWLALALGDDRSAYGYGWNADRSAARERAIAECSGRTSGARVRICISAYGE